MLLMKILLSVTIQIAEAKLVREVVLVHLLARTVLYRSLRTTVTSVIVVYKSKKMSEKEMVY